MASVGLVSLLLIAVALAYQHVSGVTQQNNRALGLAARVATTLDQIPSAVRQADHALQDQLALPTGHAQSTVILDLHAAHTQVAELAADPQLFDVDWHDLLVALQTTLDSLAQAMQQLLDQYQQPGWLYPAIPLIAGTMYEANTAVDTDLATAIAETAAQLHEPDQMVLYIRLVTLRDRWRRMILDFRSNMIQFAGLSGAPIPDNSAMAEMFDTVRRQVRELEDNPDQITYGFETTEIISTLGRHMDNWFEDYGRVRELQASGRWRSDVQYVEKTIRPLQRSIDRQLLSLERAVTSWSTRNSAAVRDAATDINYILWAMAALALASAMINYLILDRGLLRPVADVSDALAAEAEGARDIALPASRHLEITRLVGAFEHMRTQIQVRQHALEHQALHDVLTGLPNRALLYDRLEQGLRNIERTSGDMGLLLLDLDRFKEINDTLGHQMGDRVLQEVALRLAHLVRDSDTVARLGGDEFAAVLPGLDREAATELARRIVATLDQPYVINQQTLYLGASIGVVVAPEDGSDPATLLRRADSAMYSAKRGSQDYAFYNAGHDLAASQSLRLNSRLRTALTSDLGLTLHYQPRLSLSRDRIVSIEALLRWQDEDGAWIPPERIVRIAENTNLIKDLTRWVLDRALQDCAHCQEQGLELGLSVNLSARNLDDNTLPAIVQSGLHRHDLAASALTLEITEGAVMADPKRAKQLLDELASMGITLSIDDFGTGFSSLAYLSQLPVHELKIDKSFVLGMARNDNDAVIVHSIIDLAHNLGLRVVAEGVETDETLSRLRTQDCDEAQGYLISRPIPLEDLLPFIRQHVTLSN